MNQRYLQLIVYSALFFLVWTFIAKKAGLTQQPLKEIETEQTEPDAVPIEKQEVLNTPEIPEPDPVKSESRRKRRAPNPTTTPNNLEQRGNQTRVG